MKKIIVMLAVCSFIASNLSASVFAQNDYSQSEKPFQNRMHSNNGKFTPGANGKEHRSNELGKKLNLTEEQRAKAKAIHEQSRAKMEPIIKELRAEKENLMKMKKSGASQEQIKTQREQMKPLREKARKLHEENLSKFEAILTSEQKTNFKQIKQEMIQKRKEMKKNRPNGQYGQNNFKKNSSQNTESSQ